MMHALNSPALTDLFLLDVETVPQVATFSELNPLWQRLWSDKISKTVPETISLEDSWKMRAGILAEFGKIICISTAYFYNDNNGEQALRIKSFFGDDEKHVLEQFKAASVKFFQHNQCFQFAGHNIREFDIPYICRRMIINNIPLPEFLQLHAAKPWDVKMVDTLQWWKFGDYKNYISLDLLAHVLGVPTSKTDMDGSKVQDEYYYRENIQKIVEYCQRDVVVVANVLRKFQQLGALPEAHITVVC